MLGSMRQNSETNKQHLLLNVSYQLAYAMDHNSIISEHKEVNGQVFISFDLN